MASVELPENPDSIAVPPASHATDKKSTTGSGPYSTLQVIRRNGKVTAFDADKIAVAVTKAFLAVEGGNAAASGRVHEMVANLTRQVTENLTRRNPDGGMVHIEDIQDQVELALMRAGEHKVARDYVLYRESRAKEREAAVEGIVIAVIFAELIFLSLSATRRGGHPQSLCQGNLMAIGLALQNYHDAHGCFPPAYIADENGNAMHSWRGLILPSSIRWFRGTLVVQVVRGNVVRYFYIQIVIQFFISSGIIRWWRGDLSGSFLLGGLVGIFLINHVQSPPCSRFRD